MDRSRAEREVAGRPRELDDDQLVAAVVRWLRAGAEFDRMDPVEEGPIDAFGRVTSHHSNVYGPYAVRVHARESPVGVAQLREFLPAVDERDCVLALVVSAGSFTDDAREYAEAYVGGDYDGELVAEPMLFEIERVASDMLVDSAYSTPVGVEVEGEKYAIDEAFWDDFRGE